MSLPFETYHGYVRTPLDAIYLFEACRNGRLPRVQRRLSEKERQLIKAGSIFVWDEREAGMRRWTDGKAWSASRVSGSFLTYREMEGKKSISSTTALNSDDESNSESGIISISQDGFKYKANGLMKQSFSITTTTGTKLHLISYYPRSHTNLSKLKTPSLDPMLSDLIIPHGLYPDTIENPHGIPMNNNHQQPIQPSRPQLPMSNQYFSHPQQVPPMIPNGPPPPPPTASHPAHPSHIPNAYPLPPPPPPPIQTHPHHHLNSHLQYNPPQQYYQPPPPPPPYMQQQPPQQIQAPLPPPPIQQQPPQLPPPPPQPYMYRSSVSYPTSVAPPAGTPAPPPFNTITPVLPPHVVPYQDRAYSPSSMPNTQSPVPPPIQYSKRPSIQSPEMKREPSASYPTPTLSVIHTSSQPPTPIDIKSSVNRPGPRMMSLSNGSGRVGKSPKGTKSRAAFPKQESMLKSASPIAQPVIPPPFTQAPHPQQQQQQLPPPPPPPSMTPVNSQVNVPPSPRSSFSNSKLPLPSFTNRDGTLTLPSLYKFPGSHSNNNEKPMWREDIRAIQVLDKGFI